MHLDYTVIYLFVLFLVDVAWSKLLHPQEFNIQLNKSKVTNMIYVRYFALQYTQASKQF